MCYYGQADKTAPACVRSRRKQHNYRCVYNWPGDNKVWLIDSGVVPDQTLLPSNHEKPQFEPHSTLIGKHDVKHRVERWEDEVGKENLGNGGDKQHLVGHSEKVWVTIMEGRTLHISTGLKARMMRDVLKIWAWIMIDKGGLSDIFMGTSASVNESRKRYCMQKQPVLPRHSG